MSLVRAFKKALVDRELKGVIRAQKAGCCDVCEYGPTVVVYPEGVFYGNVQLADVEEIVESHLVNNEPVVRLIIDFSKPGHKDPAVS
jgi:(2Fe-2S) ferredoxin